MQEMISAVMRETGMDYLQARNHVKARLALAASIRKVRHHAAAR